MHFLAYRGPSKHPVFYEPATGAVFLVKKHAPQFLEHVSYGCYQVSSILGSLQAPRSNISGTCHFRIWFPKESLLSGSGSVSSALGTSICTLPTFGPSAREILCAGAVNGDGQVAPVYAEVVAHADKTTYEKTDVASKLALASWVPPGYFLGA